eukprot:jgi/Undpi1/12157/HiC_scaffold_5.g01833.m1
MIVFGDSTIDAGRRMDAPASFDFDDIGPFPWAYLFHESNSDSMFEAYLPAAGSVTNGKVWPSFIGVPEEYNYATSGASASEAFRSLETCMGYTGEGEDYPTGTLSEQITRYFSDVVGDTDATLDYTHVVAVGGSEPGHLLDAAARYASGGADYSDPIAFENVFEVTDGVPTLSFAPMAREIVSAWKDGITRLLERGVTGRILLANLPSPRGFPADSWLVEIMDQVFIQIREEAQSIADANAQVRVLDFYMLSAAIVDDPELFESQGFTGSSGSALTDPCLVPDFAVDFQAEIMGTQADRDSGCQEECALCADDSFPCQTCFEGNPSATVCDDPDTYIFWDETHLTAGVHEIVGEAIRECAEDNPDYDITWVGMLCPDDA